MKKVVINKCYGGFSLSDKAKELYCKLKDINEVDYWRGEIERDDPILIQVVDKFGEAANGSCAKLRIIEIPEEIDWQVEEYDGMEWVAQKHQTWG